MRFAELIEKVEQSRTVSWRNSGQDEALVADRRGAMTPRHVIEQKLAWAAGRTHTSQPMDRLR